MKKRFSEEQIINILKEADAGMKIAALCRKYNISNPTYYAWKAKFGGLSVSEAQRLRILRKKTGSLKDKLQTKPWILFV